MTEANPEVLDQDRDVGGERKLLGVPMEADEALVCVNVFCPLHRLTSFAFHPPWKPAGKPSPGPPASITPTITGPWSKRERADPGVTCGSLESEDQPL
jgi:hypothetical protein